MAKDGWRDGWADHASSEKMQAAESYVMGLLALLSSDFKGANFR